MRDVARRALLAVAAAMMLAGLGLSGVAAQAPNTEAEVRITARRLADGRTEFALQERASGESWGERRLPRARFFPASPAVGRWLSSSVLTIEVSALATHSAEGAESVEVRIVARRLADGLTEFALLERAAGDSWGERRLPRSRFFPAGHPVGLWLSSSPLTVGVAGTAPVPVAAEPPPIPEITTIHVPNGDGIVLVFIGDEQLSPRYCQSSTNGNCTKWSRTVAEERAFLTAEMGKIAAFFAERWAVAPPPVLISVSLNAPLSPHQAGNGFISTAYIGDGDRAHTLAHEYYHVLQFALAGAPRHLQPPKWLVEGSAEYGSRLYSGEPIGDLGYQLSSTTEPIVDAFHSEANTATIGWLAEHAGANSHVEYWRELGRLKPQLCVTSAECRAPGAVTWGTAFETVFGLTPEALYARLEAERTEGIRAWKPHTLDDLSEPIVVTRGDVAASRVAEARAEIARLQALVGPSDFTLVLADAASFPEAYTVVTGRTYEGQCYGDHGVWTVARQVTAVFDASCPRPFRDAAHLRFVYFDLLGVPWWEWEAYR